MQKIILFYIFTPLDDVEAIKLWQQNLAASLKLSGRIIIASHGINATLGGEIDYLKKYIKNLKTYPKFKNIEFKWSDGSSFDFPRLSVKIRKELVSFNIDNELAVNQDGVIGGGKRIKPKQLHDFIEKNNKQVVFMDGRNAREAAIGKFKGAVVLDVEHTRDMPKEITKSKYNNLKDKAVITYCTGGIRCEVLSKLLIDEGYSDVYQLDGGIIKYLEEYKDDGLWEGSLFVFDKRMSIDSSPNTKIISKCTLCLEETNQFMNCSDLSCNELILACRKCQQQNSYCYKCTLDRAVLN